MRAELFREIHAIPLIAESGSTIEHRGAKFCGRKELRNSYGEVRIALNPERVENASNALRRSLKISRKNPT